MALKRNFPGDGNEDQRGPPKKKLSFADAVKGVMRGVPVDEVLVMMEALFRRVVKEEIEKPIEEMEKFLRSVHQPSHRRIGSSGERGLQLRFETKIISPIFTGNSITSENHDPVKIVLFDASSNSIVASGPLSSAKIGIVVLCSDFGSDDQDNWTEKEFTDSILRERDGKRPLITGELSISLRDGVGYIGDLSFTDNSSWTRNNKFKLGAKYLETISSDTRIREAASGAFKVKDHRGESTKKHHPPHLCDDVWRLEKIRKDGPLHKRLAKEGIVTLKDFLRMYFIDPSKLHKVLGAGVMSNRIWGTVIEHAITCVVDDDQLYVYRREQAGIVFNSIYKVVEVTFDGRNFYSPDALDFSQKFLMDELKRHAYKNVEEIVPIDRASVSGFGRPLANLQADPFCLDHLDFPVEQQQEIQVGFNNAEVSTSYALGAEAAGSLGVPFTHNFHLPDMLANPQAEPLIGPNSSQQHLDIPVLQQQETHVGFNNAEASTSYAFEAEAGGSLEVPLAHNFNLADMFCPTMRNSFRMVDYAPGPNFGWFPNWSPAVPWRHEGIGTSGNEPAGIDFVSALPDLSVHISRRSRAGWCMIRAAIKWKTSVR